METLKNRPEIGNCTPGQTNKKNYVGLMTLVAIIRPDQNVLHTECNWVWDRELEYFLHQFY